MKLRYRFIWYLVAAAIIAAPLGYAANTIKKRLAGVEDIAWWDGSNSTRTFTETDNATGKVYTLHKVGHEIVLPDSISPASALTGSLISTTAATIGTNRPITIRLRPGNWSITADLTLTKNIQLAISAGTTLNIASTKVLTANIEAGRYPIFTGSGKAILPYNTIACPEWWGGGVSATSAANDAALAAAAYALAPTYGGNGGTVLLNGGEYSATTYPVYRGVCLTGSGDKYSIIKVTGSVNFMIVQEDIEGQTYGFNMMARNLTIDSSANTNNIILFYSYDKFLYLWGMESVTFIGNGTKVAGVPQYEQQAMYATHTTGNGVYSGRFKLCNFKDFYHTTAAVHFAEGYYKCNDHLFEWCWWSGFRSMWKIEGSNNHIVHPHANSQPYSPVLINATSGSGVDFYGSFGNGYSNNVVEFPYFDGSVYNILIYSGTLSSSANTYPIVTGNVDEEQIFTPNSSETYTTASGILSYFSSTTFTLTAATDLTSTFFKGKMVCIYNGADGYCQSRISSSTYLAGVNTIILEDPYLTSNLLWIAGSGIGTSNRHSLRISNGNQYMPNLEVGRTYVGQPDHYISRFLVGTTAYDFNATPLTIGNHTTAHFTMNATGVKLGDKVSAFMTVPVSGIIPAECVAGNDNMTIYFGNITGSNKTLNTLKAFRWEAKAGF